MNGEVLVFDESREAGEALIVDIRKAYRRLSGAAFSIRDPAEVFTEPLPHRPRAAFFTVSGIYEAEAVRKFHACYGGEVPIIIVSDSGEYDLWSWRLGTSCYLKRPVTPEELSGALETAQSIRSFQSFTKSGGKRDET